MVQKRNKFTGWLLKVATAQAYITATSLPILAFWGMPLSMATFFGNIIASPLIAVHIFISALTFFTALIGIPNLIFIKGLELSSFIILKFVSLGSPSWLLGVPAHTPLILVPFVATFLIFYFQGLHRLIALMLLLATSITTAKLLPAKQFTETLKCNNSKVVVCKDSSGTSMQCKVCIGNNPGINSWLDYNLLPLLYKQTGSNKIDTISLDQEPSPELDNILRKHLKINQIEIKPAKKPAHPKRTQANIDAKAASASPCKAK